MSVLISAGNTISATLLFQANVTNNPASAGSPDIMELNNISLVIQDKTAQQNNLLSIIQDAGSSTGILFGNDGASLANVKANTSLGNKFTYTSKYLSFASGGSRKYVLNMTLLDALGINNTNGYIDSFSTSSSGGSFSASSFNPIPEASTLIGFGGMLMGGGVLCGRRRKKTA